MRLLISEIFILPIKDENLYTKHFSIMNFSSPERKKWAKAFTVLLEAGLELSIVSKGPIFSKLSEGKAVASVMGS